MVLKAFPCVALAAAAARVRLCRGWLGAGRPPALCSASVCSSVKSAKGYPEGWGGSKQFIYGWFVFFWVKICRDFAYIIISQTMHLQDEGLWNKEGRIFLLPAYSFFFSSSSSFHLPSSLQCHVSFPGHGLSTTLQLLFANPQHTRHGGGGKAMALGLEEDSPCLPIFPHDSAE